MNRLSVKLCLYEKEGLKENKEERDCVSNTGAFTVCRLLMDFKIVRIECDV